MPSAAAAAATSGLGKPGVRLVQGRCFFKFVGGGVVQTAHGLRVALLHVQDLAHRVVFL